jgi:dihydrolipoamide dehydrogenase
MYAPEQSAQPMFNAMHIHPALTEVVQRAFQSLMPAEEYYHLLEHHYHLPLE